MSSATEGTSQPVITSSQAGRGEGGRWRQVRFEELSSVPINEPGTTARQEAKASAKPVENAQPKLRLERRQQLEHHLKKSPTDLDGYMELGRIYRADDRPLERNTSSSKRGRFSLTNRNYSGSTKRPFSPDRCNSIVK
jgi:hypothetical protein